MNLQMTWGILLDALGVPGPHQPSEANPRSALPCVASSSENPFLTQPAHEESLTQSRHRFGAGGSVPPGVTRTDTGLR